MDPAARVIHFVLGNRATHWRDIEDLEESRIALEPRRFVAGRNSWIAQTYVRLRPALEARGWTVTIGDCFEPGAIVVVHRDDANDFATCAHASYLVVVRADRAPVAACDLAIVQNRIDNASHERFLPLWPQPGLRARDTLRGNAVRRIAYYGRTTSAPAWFSDKAFLRALRRRGIEFDIQKSNWEDYRRVDVAIAAREDSGTLLATKPATKVYNAWLAGVPVLAAPEPAYVEIRRGPLDFIEIHDGDDVLGALDRLRAEPGLFEAMASHGLERGREFSVDAIRARWLGLLEEEVLPAFSDRMGGLASRRLWHLRAMAAQKAMSRVHRARIAYQRWSVRHQAVPLLNLARRSGQGAVDDFADVPGETFGAAD
ncbi:MAG TPA: hypothetical protein VGI57_09265 [Usitatibacter sp.]